MKPLLKAAALGVLAARVLPPAFLIVTGAVTTILNATILRTVYLGIAPFFRSERAVSMATCAKSKTRSAPATADAGATPPLGP